MIIDPDRIPENPGPDGECPDCWRTTNQARFFGYIENNDGTERAGYYECPCGNVYGIPEKWSKR